MARLNSIKIMTSSADPFDSVIAHLKGQSDRRLEMRKDYFNRAVATRANLSLTEDSLLEIRDVLKGF